MLVTTTTLYDIIGWNPRKLAICTCYYKLSRRLINVTKSFIVLHPGEFVDHVSLLTGLMLLDENHT